MAIIRLRIDTNKPIGLKSKRKGKNGMVENIAQKKKHIFFDFDKMMWWGRV